MSALIELEDIRKSFGPVDVLKGVTMAVHPGKVSALVGDNGAGKSTLIKGLSGAQPYDDGEIRFEGNPVTIHTPQDASGLGIEVVYQDLALCENLDIVNNMFLGRERTAHGMLDQPDMEGAAAGTLQALSVRTLKSVRQKVSSLSGGQRQTVAIARAVLQEAKIVILDEPTAALGVAQTEQVLALVRRLADSGTAVLIISHNLADVFEVADYINVLYLGTMVAQLETKNTTYDEVVGWITGSKIKDPAVWKASDMSSTSAPSPTPTLPLQPSRRSRPDTREASEQFQNYFSRVRSGEMGMLPALAGRARPGRAVLLPQRVLPDEQEHREPTHPDGVADDPRDRPDLPADHGRDRPVRRHHRRRRDGRLHPAGQRQALELDRRAGRRPARRSRDRVDHRLLRREDRGPLVRRDAGPVPRPSKA